IHVDDELEGVQVVWSISSTYGAGCCSHARAVHCNTQWSHRFREIDRLLNIRRFGHVADLHTYGLAELFGEGVSALRIAVDDDYRGPIGCKPAHNGFAEPGCAASDDCGLTFDIHALPFVLKRNK